MLASGLLGGVAGMLASDNSLNLGVTIGSIISVISCTGLSFMILNKKGVMGNLVNIVLALLSGVAALFLGGLAGLIIPAYFTTK
jgi:hypothetical protein